MIRRSKRLRAFTTGCLASLVVFGYPSQLLAQSNSMDNPVQGITSTTQEAPATAAEVNDVMTGLSAGVGIGDLIQPKPDPIREHTAFLTSMWDVLLDSDYSAENSYLTTEEWITGPSGTLIATNENGNSVSVDITLSLEVLPEQWSFVDQESIDILTGVSARIGMAWTTMSNTDGAESNILIWWYQWNSPTGIETAIGPIDTTTQEDVDLLAAVVPLMDGFFDDPLNYNIENYDPDIFSIWSRFRNTVLTAVVAGVALTVGAMVAAAIIVTAPATLAGVAAVIAGATVARAITTAAIAVVGTTGIAYLNLTDDLAAAGHPVSANPLDNLALARLLH